MRSNDREQLKRDIKDVTESALEGGGNGDNHVVVSVNVSGAACERGPADPLPVPTGKRSKRRRERLNPNLIIDRLFRLGVVVVIFAAIAYWMYLNRF